MFVSVLLKQLYPDDITNAKMSEHSGTPRRKPRSRKDPEDKREWSPKHNPLEETVSQPTPHQLKLFLNIVCKAQYGKMSVGDFRASCVSNGSVKQFASFPALEELLEELRIFRLSAGHGNDRIVKACTELEICDSFATEGRCLLGDMCPKIHLCIRYVFGQKCDPPKGNKCPFGHVLGTEHNSPLIKTHYMDILAKPYTLKLLQDKYIHLKFKVCGKHSTTEGCRKPWCKMFHVCKYFLQNRCNAKGYCRRSHDLAGPQPQGLLSLHGFDLDTDTDWIIQEMKDLYTFKSTGEDAGGEDTSRASRSSHGSTNKQPDSQRQKQEPMQMGNKAHGMQQSHPGSDMPPRYYYDPPEYCYQMPPPQGAGQRPPYRHPPPQPGPGPCPFQGPGCYAVHQGPPPLMNQPPTLFSDPPPPFQQPGPRGERMCMSPQHTGPRGERMRMPSPNQKRSTKANEGAELEFDPLKRHTPPSSSNQLVDFEEFGPPAFDPNVARVRPDDDETMLFVNQSPLSNKEKKHPREKSAAQGVNLLDEICLYHLRGQCGYKDSCKNYHCLNAYQWQEWSDGMWINMAADDNATIEVNYSDPSKVDCFIGDMTLW